MLAVFWPDELDFFNNPVILRGTKGERERAEACLTTEFIMSWRVVIFPRLRKLLSVPMNRKPSGKQPRRLTASLWSFGRVPVSSCASHRTKVRH